jgi:ABC-type lipoprotein export system ATPase subunit
VFWTTLLPGFYKGDENIEYAKELLSLVGLLRGSASNQTSYQVSEAACAIARALMNNPAFILADNPPELDSKTGKEIMELIVNLNKKKKNRPHIHHDPNIAKQAHQLLDFKMER